jgi:hypothetical protein
MKTPKKTLAATLALSLLLLIPTSDASMMRSEMIEHANAQAPEIASLIIEKVSTSDINDYEKHVTATARVLHVEKTSSGLEAGQTIELSFTAWAPDAFPPGYYGPYIPQEGETLTSYMESSPNGSTYKPQNFKPGGPPA